MPVIAARHIQKIYGKGEAAFDALSDINLTIEASETVAIVGKSGSGKSTLMHLLALLDKPTQGSVLVDTADASRLTSQRLDRLRNRRFGFVFQQFFLNERDTVLNNVVLPLKIAGINRKARQAQGMKVLAAVQLEQKAGSKAGTLSGGQKQRVCIARALVNNPSIIFADEPTGNLDSQTGQLVENLLFQLNKSHGITLIIVTHDEVFAARCDRQLYIKDGKLVNRGTL
jgi:putative ABC transport system ATP-binding protein